MDYGLFGVRFLFLDMKMERCSIDELLIYFATPPFMPATAYSPGMCRLPLPVIGAAANQSTDIPVDSPNPCFFRMKTMLR